MYESLIQNPATPTGAGATPAGGADDSLFDSLLWQESRGKQLRDDGTPVTSKKGAIGIAQVMPGTAPEAARLAGLEFDDFRYRTDADYNKQLGRAYFNKQLADFGDESQALAAYNAGPGAMRNALAAAQRAGTPDQWMRFLPAETQAYVPAIMAKAGRVPGVKVPASAGGQRTPVAAAASEFFTPSRGEYASLITPPLPERSTLESAKDSAVALGSGLAAGVSALASVAGADNPVARGADQLAKDIEDHASPYRKEQRARRAALIQEAEDSGSPWNEIVANVGAFAEAPFDTLLNAVGSSAPTLLTAAVPGIGQANAVRYIAQGAMGAAQGMGAVKGSIYEGVQNEMIKQGMSPSEAAKVAAGAQAYDSANKGQIAIGGLLGLLAGTTGAEASVSRIAHGAGPAAAARSAAGKVGGGLVKEGATEAAQGGQERLASNVALQNEGVDVPTWQGVAGQAALEGIAGGMMGGGFGAVEAITERPAVPPALQPVAEAAAKPNSPLSRAAMAGNSPEAVAARADQDQAQQQSASAKPDSSVRLAELEAIAKGTAETAGPDGQRVPGTPSRFFTPEEKAEYDQLVSLRDATQQVAQGNQPQRDTIGERVVEIETQIRDGAVMDQLRAEGADTKGLIKDLAIAKSPSTGAAQREQALARVEYTLGWAQPAQPAAAPAAAAAADPIAAALTSQQLSASDRQALLAARGAMDNPALLQGTRDAARAQALEIAGRYAAPAGEPGAAAPAAPAVLGDIPPAPGTPAEALREAERFERGAQQFAEAGFEADAVPLQEQADSLREEAATRRAAEFEAARVEDVPAPQVRTTPAGPGVAYMRRRRATLDQLVADGLNRVERRDDGQYLVSQNGKRQHKLENPVDAQMARAAISAGIRHGAAQANTNPTQAQKEAGNYKVGEVKFDGLTLAIENPQGSERSGVDPSGERWSTIMPANYGYVRGSAQAADGDKVDIYLPDTARAGSPAWIIDQYNDDGSFDETKTVLGVATEADATRIYDAGFSDGSGPRRRGAITSMPIEEFKAWVMSPAAKKPAGPAPQREPTEIERLAAEEPAVTGVGESFTIRADGKPVVLLSVPVDQLGTKAKPAREGRAMTITKSQAKALAGVAEVFGKRIVFFRTEAALGDGFVQPGDSSTVFLNVESGISPMAVFGHELMHLLEMDNPKAHAAVRDAIRTRLKDGATEKMSRYYRDDEILNEITSDLSGDLMMDPKFWADVFDRVRDESAVAALIAMVRRYVAKLVASLQRPGYDAQALVNDVEEIRTALRDAMATYARAAGTPLAKLQAQALRAEQDIRRSESEPQAQRSAPRKPVGNENLLVVHNLTQANLLAAEDLGGLAVPSLAIANVDAPLDSFGEITLLGDKGLAKPGAKNPVFDADVYSPRFPSVQVKVNEKMVRDAVAPLMQIAADMGVGVSRPDGAIDQLERNRVNDAINRISYDVGMRLGYAKAVLGKDLTVPMKDVAAAPTYNAQGSLVQQSPLLEYLATVNVADIKKEDSAELAQKVYAALFNRTYARFAEESSDLSPNESFKQVMKAVNRRIGMFAETTIEKDSDDLDFEKVGLMTSKGLVSLANLQRFARDEAAAGGADAAPARPTQEVDHRALEELLDREAPREGFDEWLREKITPAIGERRVVKDNGRTVPYTMENVVREMTRSVRDAEGFNYGLGNARSRGATRFKSLAQIQGMRDRVVPNEVFESAREEIKKEFDELVREVTPFQRYERDSGFELLAEAIGDSYVMPIDRALEKATLTGLPEDLRRRIAEFAGALVNAPAEYFEAKPQRAVQISEFRGAVIPDDATARTREILQQHGLRVEEYQARQVESRREAIKRLAVELDDGSGNVIFSRERAPEKPADLDPQRIPGAELSDGVLRVPASSVDQANAELARAGLTTRFSKERLPAARAEYEAVEKRLRDTEAWMKGPNGQPTKLTERQWIHVRTPSFKRWFGDWEAAHAAGGVWAVDNVSKAVDKDTGEPLVVYHGSGMAGFAEFERPKGERRGDLGIFVTDNRSMAESYARRGRPRAVQEGDLSDDAERFGGVYALFMNVRNPNEENFEGANWDGSRENQWIVEVGGEQQLDSDGRGYFSEDEAREFAQSFIADDDPDGDPGDYMRGADEHWNTTDGVVREAHNMGSDGAIIREVTDDGGGPSSYTGEPSDIFVAFDPNQVKSADFNDGTYSLNLDDIRRSAERQAPEQRQPETAVEEPAGAANAREQAKAEAYEQAHGILPYVSAGQLEVEIEDIVQSVKREGKYGMHPVLGIPVNANGTVTLYYPTTNEGARRVVRDRTLVAAPGASRIYLTNESSASEVTSNPGDIDQEMDGANVLLQIDPALVQLDAEHPSGRRDFFVPVREGKAFFDKLRAVRLFTQNAPRDQALSVDTKLTDLEREISDSLAAYLKEPAVARRQMLREARALLKEQHNVTTLLGVNGKLEKTNLQGYRLDNYTGQDVISMGLGLASAQKINEKDLSTCPNSAICEGLCLGETSGQNQLYGGVGQFRSGPRLSQYLKTEALVQHPREFALALHAEIAAFERSAKRGDLLPSVRLNVTSDFRPATFRAIIEAFPDVMFYDYTKLPSKEIAENHHLTYSSTGASQIVNGATIENPESNWDRMVRVLHGGSNVAMAFTSRTAMPKTVVDGKSGQRFEVWNGDLYDARFLDPKRADGVGMIVGLTNKDRTTKPEDAARVHRGFFVDYDPARDGDTVVIPDQQALKSPKPQPVHLVRNAKLEADRAIQRASRRDVEQIDALEDLIACLKK